MDLIMGDGDSVALESPSLEKQAVDVDVDEEGSGGLEPKLPKRKAEDDGEEDKGEDEEEDGNDNDDEDDTWSLGLGDYEGSEQQEKDFNKYLEECNASDCFDVETIPQGKHFMGMLSRVKIDDDDDFFSKHCKQTVQLVIDQQNNENGMDLELVKVTKANRESSTFYYATFEARNRTSGELETYQTSVFHCFIDGELKVYIFRLKETGDGQGNQ
ncbi:uncharacterized protein LOC126682505 [Mercurialis annua]|uniref:uncharacterized protein LOC126682505 n=1 Tax=Mercurialis annua TaxID=3986 RepID=UPI002160B1BB|nr:uncharacterized protein LOC126682505 [Mercurialis annua]